MKWFRKLKNRNICYRLVSVPGLNQSTESLIKKNIEVVRDAVVVVVGSSVFEGAEVVDAHSSLT